MRARFGFFGQITEYKGVEILLQAIHLIAPEFRAKMIVEIHGANLETQAPGFQELIETLRKPLIIDGVLRWVGSYEQAELAQRMDRVDWVVVPSIWWENSPMVIQEAFANGKPVICAGIGGMAEKVRDFVDGLHFEVRNPLDLAETMIRAAVRAWTLAEAEGQCPRASHFRAMRGFVSRARRLTSAKRIIGP